MFMKSSSRDTSNLTENFFAASPAIKNILFLSLIFILSSFSPCSAAKPNLSTPKVIIYASPGNRTVAYSFDLIE